jgi:hypothetical protein
MVLQNRQSRSRLQLLIVHGKQIGLSLLDIKQHLLPQLLRLLDPLKLLLLHLVKSECFLVSKRLLKVFDLLLHTLFLINKGRPLSLLIVKELDLVLKSFLLRK